MIKNRFYFLLLIVTVFAGCKDKNEHEGHISQSVEKKNDVLTILLKPTNEYVISQVKTTRPEHKGIPVEIEASGKIGYDTRMVNVVSARISGRIEKLYVKYRFQPILKGAKADGYLQ